MLDGADAWVQTSPPVPGRGKGDSMTLYGFALFVHVVFAILLVGGSAYAHLTVALVPRARTVEGVRSHVAWMHAFVKASGPLAGVVLLAGLYMTSSANLWGAGWPVVSLVLFAMGGAAAAGIIDPKVTAIRTALDEVADGPVTDDVRALRSDRVLTMLSWTLAGADLAIVYLMTNKPGWAGSLVVGVGGLVLGAAVGMREMRHAAVAVPPSAPAV